MNKEESRSVLVTGCSSGIGLATARLLRDRGWTVYATARKPEDLEMLRGEKVHAVKIDLADSESVQAAAREVLEATENRLFAVVNNAGFGLPGAVEDISRDAMRKQFEVNVFGLQELTNALIPAFRAQGRGRVVNVSSVVGRLALPFLGVYSASKFALEALSDSLRVEMVDTGVFVSLVEPGGIITEFRQNAVASAEENLELEGSEYGGVMKHEIERRKARRKKPDFWTRPPEAVADKILHALESKRPRTRYGVTPSAGAVAVLRRLAPTWFIDYVLKSQVRKKRDRHQGGGSKGEKA